MKLKYIFATACAAAALFATSSQAAGATEPTADVIPNFAALQAGRIQAAAAPLGLAVVSTIAGYAADSVPCFGGKSGCTHAGSVAIPFPQIAMKGGSDVSVVTLLQDTDFAGDATIELVATQITRSGATRIYSGKATFNNPLQPGFAAYGAFPFTLPTTQGEVTLSILVVSGGTTVAKGAGKFFVE